MRQAPREVELPLDGIDHVGNGILCIRDRRCNCRFNAVPHGSSCALNGTESG